MKRLIVHIGPRKTGSTTIQTMLASHRDALGADGVYVPHAGTIRANRGTHIRLARELVHGRPVQWECLAAEVRAAGPDCCVLSVEDFALPRYRAAAAVRLAEFAARQRLDVDLLAYVRPQWQIIESEYSQQVCGRGVAVPFARFASNLLAEREDTTLDYNLVFGPFREAFGSRLRVFPLQPGSPPGGLAAHFLAQIGVTARLAKGIRAPRANTRRGAGEIEVRRLLCARLPGLRKLGVRKPVLPALAALIGPDAPFAGFSAAQIRVLEDRFADANRRFALDYGIDAAGTLFRDTGYGAGPRPNIASWEAFDADARQRIRQHVLDELGIDLEGGMRNAVVRCMLQGRLLVVRGFRRLRRRS